MNHVMTATTIPPCRVTQAVRSIRGVLRAHGGAWAVMFLDGDKGYLMARADSMRGKRMLRSGSPTIAGVFDGRIRIGDLRDALLAARTGEREGLPRRVYPSWERRKRDAYKRAWRQRRRELGLKVS